MLVVTHRLPLLAGLLALVSFLPGCNRQRNVTVTGRIVRGGQPLAVGPNGYVQVTLRPDVGPDEQFTEKIGRCEADGQFTIDDVPPGRYRVGINQYDPTPQTDKLNWAYMPDKSKIIREIDGKAPLSIDLAKPE